MRFFPNAKVIISCAVAAGMLAVLAGMPVAVLADGKNGGDSNTEVTEISDAEGLAAIAGAPDGNYLLTADIDLGGSDWTPVAFSGKLDGGGHTLYNLRVSSVGRDKRSSRDGNLKKYPTQYAGLFSVLENAEITDLRIRDAFVQVSGKSHCFAAIIAGYSDSSVINRCSVSGRVHLKNRGVNSGVAGIVGYGTGSIVRCEADVELVFEDEYRDGKCEQFLGGILSSGVGDIQDCRVKLDGYVSCHGYVHNGGLAGMYYHFDAEHKRGRVSGNTVIGQISFFEDNRDRRAYCDEFIGERLTKPLSMRGNKSQFRSEETKNYSRVLSPEKCDKPDYEDIITPSGCTEWGFTLHRCRGCGYSWADTYTSPAHVGGEWVTVSDSDCQREGLERLCCSRCGVTMDERAIPVKTEKKDGDVSAVSPRRSWAVLAAVILCIAAVVSGALIILKKNLKNFK